MKKTHFFILILAVLAVAFIAQADTKVIQQNQYTMDKSFYVASTTIDGSSVSFSTGTSTWQIWNPSATTTLSKIYCETDTGTVCLVCGDGSNKTEPVLCTSSGGEDDGSIANAAFNLREDFICEVGSTASTPNELSVTLTFN